MLVIIMFTVMFTVYIQKRIVLTRGLLYIRLVLSLNSCYLGFIFLPQNGTVCAVS